MKVAVVAKHKKRKKWPIVLLLFFVFSLILTITPIAIAYVALFDASTKTLNLDPNFSFETFASSILVDSLDDSATTKKMTMKVTEDDMDNILAQALAKVNGTSNIFSKAYMQIKGKQYNFFLDIDAKVLKTRVKISTNLEEDEKTNSFVFTINDVRIGRISGLKSIGKTLMNRFLNEETITDLLSDMGLSIKFDSEKMALIYNKDDIVSDIVALSSGEDNMMINVLDTVADQGALMFDIESNDFMDVYIDLSKIETNDYITDLPGSQIKIQADEVTQKVKKPLEKLVNVGNVDPEKDNLTYIYEYLFGGYSYIKNNEEKVNLVKSIDFSPIGIENSDTAKENYKGFDITSGDNDLKQKMVESISIPSLLLGSKELCSLTEEDVNSYVSGRSVVGYTFLLHRRVDDETYKINYITIDNFYCNIYKQDEKNIADFICKININGLHTSLVFNCEVPAEVHDDNKMTFYVQNVSYGNLQADNLTETFFDVVIQALKGGDTSISADKTVNGDKIDYSISFDFNSIINDAKTITETEVRKIPTLGDWSGDEYFKGSNIDIQVEGEDKNANGILKLSLKEGITIPTIPPIPPYPPYPLY